MDSPQIDDEPSRGVDSPSADLVFPEHADGERRGATTDPTGRHWKGLGMTHPSEVRSRWRGPLGVRRRDAPRILSKNALGPGDDAGEERDEIEARDTLRDTLPGVDLPGVDAAVGVRIDMCVGICVRMRADMSACVHACLCVQMCRHVCRHACTHLWRCARTCV